MNDTPVGCQNREWTEPQRDRWIFAAGKKTDEVVKRILHDFEADSNSRHAELRRVSACRRLYKRNSLRNVPQAHFGVAER